MGAQLPLQLALRGSATFENFVAAGQGEIMQALQYGTEPFIYLAGGSGSGKTHLLQAACHDAAARERSVAYVPLLRAAEFGIESVAGLEHIERVCLDDIHAIAGQMPWEQALFRLFNRLREHGGQLIVAAAHKASQLPFVLPDLVSRLNWGVTYGLQPLDDADKITALRLRAEARGFELPDEVGRYLLTRLPRDMHALFAVLDQLDYASLAAQRRLTVPFIKTIIA